MCFTSRTEDKMSNIKNTDIALPVAPLKIAALEGCMDLAKLVDSHIVDIRKREAEKIHYLLNLMDITVTPICLTAIAQDLVLVKQRVL